MSLWEQGHFVLGQGDMGETLVARNASAVAAVATEPEKGKRESWFPALFPGSSCLLGGHGPTPFFACVSITTSTTQPHTSSAPSLCGKHVPGSQTAEN